MLIKMNKIQKVLLMMAGCMVLLSSCLVNIGLNKIKPSENVVERAYPQSAFDKIAIGVTGQVRFVQSEDANCRVVLKAPDNYLDLFKLEVTDGKLKVGFKERNTEIETKDVMITIYAPELSELENTGVADVEAASLQAEELTLVNSGVGHIKTDGEAVRVKLVCSGVGDIDAAGLKARTVTGSVSGVGGVSCYASDSLVANVSGVGSLTYAGNPTYKKENCSGVGAIQPK